ncbi:MAG: HAMP domain-containing protein, partial [Spirochaetales bacterium]|nr:HAMP domain-containing protein [Spirochaetales bacterium]
RWEGVESLIRLPSQMGIRMGMQGANTIRGPRASGQDSGSAFTDQTPRGQFRALPVVLTGPAGGIIFSSIDVTVVKLPENTGIPVYNGNNSEIGKIFAGSMIGSKLLPVQEAFLASVQRAILLASIIVILITFVISYFLVKHITSPIRALYKASDLIAKGDLDVRVNIKRKDELGELATGFNSMTKSLQKAENWKRQIIADSAHELRTPVSLIQGHLEMMLEGVYPIDREGIKTIFNETVLLTSLISELQELSSVEAGQTTLVMEKLDLGEVVDSIGKTFKARLDEKNIAFNIEMDSNLPEVVGDRQKLYQVLLNVVSNSLKFTQSGGLITISAMYDRPSALVLLAVEDSGPGIAAEERSKIFDRFYRIDKHRNRDSGGSGLGLAISREIIGRHGGTLKAVDPLSGKGTRILITLPV